MRRLSHVVPAVVPTDAGHVPAISVSTDAGEAKSFLPPPAPIREDQVANAVSFLSHPNVKGSPVKFRRSFLERKGLTAPEIDEAFRRVPVRAS